MPGYAVLACEPNAEVRAVHPKAMPVIRTRKDEIAAWMTADRARAKDLHRPLPDVRRVETVIPGQRLFQPSQLAPYPTTAGDEPSGDSPAVVTESLCPGPLR